MNKKFQILLAFFLVLSVVVQVAQPAGTVKAAETRNIVILGTSDIHGNVDNYDYFTDSVPTGSAARGLTKVSTYVNQVRAANPSRRIDPKIRIRQACPHEAAGWAAGRRLLGIDLKA